ncbi:hypothetical protein [Glaciibacter superstes]|uniref:hypothetical protein n=1 Tax=Glaciibacter superstes TaxID=501023 RepID=UPI0003B44C2A|nr:hypothetical protein [Glaciibacter superstes]
MRMKKRGLVVAILACTLVLAALSGCTPTPAPTPIPTSTTDAPVFESDEEALAAATEAYAAYQAMSNTIAQEGGRAPERISEFSTGAVLKSEVESFSKMEENGFHGTGDLSFDSFSIQSADLVDGIIQAYLCLDVSGTDVVDSTGASVVPVDRPLRLPLQVGLVNSDDAKQLLIEESESWSGENFC